MTCIVGIAEGGNVYIGGDSAGIDSTYSIGIRRDEKVFKNGPFIMGFTSSFRMGQLLRYKFTIPEQRPSHDDMTFLVSDFIDGVRDCFKDNGYGKLDTDTGHIGGTFLLGYKENLYCVYPDFQVESIICDYNAIGCGNDLALGSLYSTKDKQPKERLKLALEAASFHSAGVAPPFNFVELVK